MGIYNTYEIQPVAVETSGVCGPDTQSFKNKVGRIDAARRHKPRERRCLMERLSFAIFRGNATTIFLPHQIAIVVRTSTVVLPLTLALLS